ncbi:MAG: ThuA domain-containing protein [Anaerolineae bacterium]
MRVLVICDDYYHPASVVRAGLSLLTETTFDYIEDAGDWSAAKMAPYAAVLYAKSNNTSAANREPWITPDVEQALAEYVRAGHGMLAVHSGTVVKELAVLRALIGGTFDHHPKQCPVMVQPAAGHPLIEGVQPFTVTDEHYHMIMDDPDVDLFLTTVSEHSEQPGGWTRTEGAGRVAVLTPGHTVEAFTHPSFLRLVTNCLAWCAAA